MSFPRGAANEEMTEPGRGRVIRNLLLERNLKFLASRNRRKILGTEGNKGNEGRQKK
jgi:hypothetical protein